MSEFCKLFGYTRQAYHQQLRRLGIKRVEERMLLDQVLLIRREMPMIGTRKLHYLLEPLREIESIKCGRDKLFSLLRHEGLLIKKRRKYTVTTNSKHWLRKYPNLIKDVIPDRPEQVWVSDITYVPVPRGHQYLHLITDAYSKQIMGYELSDNLEAESTTKALKMARRKRIYPHLPLVHHSDRGLQYCSKLYTDILIQDHIQISMTENGDPYENPVAERVNGILKGEFYLEEMRGNLNENRRTVARNIAIYNRKRPHLSCSMLTPVQMHQQNQIIVKTWREKASSYQVVT